MFAKVHSRVKSEFSVAGVASSELQDVGVDTEECVENVVYTCECEPQTRTRTIHYKSEYVFVCACVWLVDVYVRPLAHARALPESVRKFQRVLCNVQYSILAVGKTLSKMMLVYCTLERAFIFVCSRRMCVSTHVSIVLCVAAKLYTQLSCSLLRAPPWPPSI